MTSVVFIGSKSLGLKLLEKLNSIDSSSLKGVITLDDSKDSRSVLTEFTSFCSENSIPLHICENRKDFDRTIKDWKPDLCIVACWYWLIKKEILDLVPMGFIGIHNSVLPRYRGGAPAVWQIIQGDGYIGVSLFYMVEEMDAGDLLGTWSIPLLDEDYISDVLEKLEVPPMRWFKRNYKPLLKGEVEANPQDTNFITPSYAAQRKPSDGEIDWSKSAWEVYNFIRAQSTPYPGAFTWFTGKKLHIWRASPVGIVHYGTPGQVLRITESGVWVSCGFNQVIEIEDVSIGSFQLKVPAAKILKSFKTRLGRKP